MMKQTEKNILIVEDEPGSAESLAIGLKRSGYFPQIALSGKEGLRKLRECAFNFILCDINMPEMDGWEFAVKAKPLTSADFIFITADSRTNKKAEFISSPLLIKPIELYRIIELLNEKGGYITKATR